MVLAQLRFAFLPSLIALVKSHPQTALPSRGFLHTPDQIRPRGGLMTALRRVFSP